MNYGINKSECTRELRVAVEKAENPDKAIPLVKFLSGWSTMYDLERWNSTAGKDKISSFYDELADIVRTVFLPKENHINKDVYLRLLPFHAPLTYIFYLSKYGNSNDLLLEIRNRSINRGPGHFAFTHESDLYKYMLLLSPFSDRGIEDLVLMAKSQPQAVVFVYLQCLASRITANPTIKQNRQKLIANLDLIRDTRLSGNSIAALHLLWAVSSYEQPENNHIIKDLLNRLLGKAIRESAPKTKTLDLDRWDSAGKPRILIPAEVIRHQHVMYRCYGTVLRELRKKFYVIVLTAEEDLGDFEWNWCDDLFTFKLGKFALNIEIDRVQKLNPDIVLYPSIGMRLWSLMLSRIRIAPLQISLMGHPDSPHASEIDYCLLGSTLADPDVNFPGNLHIMKTPGSLFDFSFDPERPNVTIRENPKVIRIAVCANIFKFSLVFLETLQKIIAHCNRPIEFHFMQNLRGIQYQVGKKQIVEGLPNVSLSVYPSLGKKQYFKLLGECDVYLSPFPFGGENSTLDALLMGLPVISLKGKEPLTRLDYRVLNALDLPEVLICENIEGYITSALKVIEDDNLRRSISRGIIEKDPQKFFEEETEKFKGELAEVVEKLYEDGLERNNRK